MQKSSDQSTGQPTLRQLVQNMLAAGLGVQSRRHREAAFSSSSATPFIIGGLVFTAGFVGTLALIVALVLR